jgi:phosphoenolpyruvate carboxykinase (ATP)
MSTSFNLLQYGIKNKETIRNASPAQLYQMAILFENGAAISDKGALILESGVKTGRSPKDKRIIERPESVNDIW